MRIVHACGVELSMSLLPLFVALLVVVAGQVAALRMQLDLLSGTLASVGAAVAAYIASRVWASKREVRRRPATW